MFKLSYFGIGIYNGFLTNREMGNPTACMMKIASSVLLKLFINGNEICHTADAP